MCSLSVADPDLDLRRGPCFDLLTLLAFLPVISSFFTQNKGVGGGGWQGPRGPSPRSTNGYNEVSLFRVHFHIL